MKRILGIVIIGLILFGCKEKTSETKEIQEVEFNQDLVNELKKMGEVDQLAARNATPPENYQHLDLEQWQDFKDSVYRSHQKRLAEILQEYGYPGFDLVGKDGSSDYWMMVQHSDHNPDFQKEVLGKMKIEIGKENADPREYGLLVDRVNINTGKAQLYGTQVEYDFDIARAFPKNLADSANVNKRRKSLGMEPLEEYLNEMTLINFEVNKKLHEERGITEPKLYKIE